MAKSKSRAAAASTKAKKSTKSTHKKKNGSTKKTKAPAPSKFLVCPESGERVFVGTATLADMKHPPSSQKRKILYKIPSAKTRQSLYDELALCLEDRESRLLPKYGGRPWSVVCRVQDASSSPFFRWYRGNLELAVLPHLLEKIPDPPKLPGYQQTEQGVRRQVVKDDDDDSDDDDEVEEEYENMTEEEIQRMESLVGRDVSTLSQVAWDHRNDGRLGAPLPTISIKWTCPLRQIFTSRKAAWDHAVELAKAEQFVDRFLHGRGKNGLSLKPFRPTRTQVLQAGKVRFLRDGLWVVGQEQNWQNERYRKLHEKEQQRQLNQQQQDEAEATVQKEAAAVVTVEQPKKRRRITGSSLFLSVHRVAHREARLKELEAEAKVAPVKEETSNETTENDNTAPKPKSKTAAKVGLPTPPRPVKSNTKRTAKAKFTLTDAERELRTLWRNELSDDQRQFWEVNAETSFQRKLDDDDQLRWDLAQQEQQQSEEEESDEEEEDESEEEEEEEKASSENESSPQEQKVSGDNDKNGSEDAEDESEEEEEVVELATDKDRALWEVFSEAEQACWKAQAAKTLPNGDKKLNTDLEPYRAYQRRIYDSYFEMTVEEYEERNLKRLKGPERRKYKVDTQKQKEQLAQGMKQLVPEAHRLLEKKIEKWLTVGFQSAKQRSARQAKKAAAASNHKQQRHPDAKPSPDPPGAKYGDEPELKTLCPLAATSTETTRANEATGFATVVSSSSTPISPSPPLGEPVGETPNRGRQVQEVSTPADEHSKLADTLNEESAKLHFRKTCEQEQTELPALAESPTKSEPDEDTKENKKEEETVEEIAPFFVPTRHYCLSEQQVKLCLDACMDHFDAVMRTVKAKDLTRELVDGFDVLRERGRGRYDMELPAFDTDKFAFLNDINKAPWMPVVKAVLGEDVVLIHKGCFLSLPDATNQNYHQDGPHLHPTSQKPCHAVNVFTPLVDMTMQHGPTEFCLGSHILGQEDWDRRYLETPLPKKGVPVMFDYRLGHRGLANASKDPRPIVYCTYARARDGKEFRDSVNFSRKRYRKLGDMVDKPMSREERTQKRQAQQEAAYDDWWANR